MGNDKTVIVTEDVWKCIKALEESVLVIPDGDQKEKANAAVEYLTALFKGEPLPLIMCPRGRLIIG